MTRLCMGSHPNIYVNRRPKSSLRQITQDPQLNVNSPLRLASSSPVVGSRAFTCAHQATQRSHELRARTAGNIWRHLVCSKWKIGKRAKLKTIYKYLKRFAMWHGVLGAPKPPPKQRAPSSVKQTGRASSEAHGSHILTRSCLEVSDRCRSSPAMLALHSLCWLHDERHVCRRSLCQEAGACDRHLEVAYCRERYLTMRCPCSSGCAMCRKTTCKNTAN